jgi:hypothetical protein
LSWLAGGNSYGKLMAAIRAMTISLGQAKKFLARHKFVVTLWTRYVFEVRHNRLLFMSGVMEYWSVGFLS